MKKILTLTAVFCFLATAIFAQSRYVDEIFTDVTVTSDVPYGQNYTVLTWATSGSSTLQTLVMDFYEPTGDTEAERPLVILLHTGNFLPNPQNAGTTGTMRDSVIVEFANRLAKMGYVAAVADYRTGWNPAAPSQEERALTLIQASYRGMQDTRTCIRFFKQDYAMNNNSYNVDTSRITVFGQGTGGYISLGTGNLDDYNEILLQKFITQASGQPVPMIVESINGDIYGTSTGVIPTGFGLPFEGDTLCIPNYVDYSSDYQLTVNVGGALGDTSWIDENSTPMISFQTPKDPFAPYMEDVLIVPTTGDLIVEVQGAGLIIPKANELGVNDIMKAAFYNDPYTTAANAVNGGNEGLYPMYRPTYPNPQDPTDPITEGSPWDWWDAAYWSQIPHPSCPSGVPVNLCNFHTINSINNPDMSATKARTYIDTIIGYFAPRACAVLDLPCSTVSTEPIVSDNVQLLVAPNPANEYVRFTSKAGEQILSIELYDLNGRLVQNHYNINNAQFDLNRNGLTTGLYFAKVRFEDGITSEKIMFE
ncbi:MAG: T9SS type A sorting domain-containing protein [Saprospiraceae bacterium]